MKNKFREIDRRNLLYGTYKYQIRMSAFHGFKGDLWIGTGTIRKWLTEIFGNEWQIDDDKPYWSKERNTKWATINRKGGGAPELYLKGDEELSLFLLRWAQ